MCNCIRLDLPIERNFISLDHLIASPLTSCLQLMGVSGCHSGGARQPSTEGLQRPKPVGRGGQKLADS